MKDRVLISAGVKQRDIRRSSHAVVVIKRSGHTGLSSSSHGSEGEGLGFLFGECGFNGVKITTLVISTKVENAKVLTKTFARRFYFLSFCSQS